MARTHTAGGGGKKAGARGCALSSACAEAPPLLGRQPPRRRLHGYSKPSRFTPLWARTRPSPSRPGHGEEFQSIALVCPERTIGYKRSLKCVTALESRSDAPPAVRSGMASLRACACAAERRSRIPCVAARNAPSPEAGWTPSTVRLGALCRWHLGVPLQVAPTSGVGWGNEATRLSPAPCTGILTCFTVRVSG